MKKLFRFALCAFALLAVLTPRAQPEAPNFPLPVRPDTLRILGVGNSFTDDGMMYLPEPVSYTHLTLPTILLV